MSSYNTDQLKKQQADFERSQQALRDKAAKEQRQREKDRYDSARRSATGPKGGCFAAGTAITTAQGAVEIAAIREGDSVLAFDCRRRAVRSCRVLKAQKYRHGRLWCIRFTDGRSVRTTAAHSFLVGASWKQARFLREGDLVSATSVSGEAVLRRVSQSGETAEIEDVHNLIVEDHFTFLAEGLIAHSFTHFRAVRIGYFRARQALSASWRALSRRLGAPRAAQLPPAPAG